MVLKGQFLERPTLIPVADLVLEGVSHRGHRAPGLLVLPPTPKEGGGMDHIVGAELAYAISRAGFPTLRFNYRGVGASQGARATSAEALLEDALAAAELARDNCQGEKPVVASIGASDAVALELARRAPGVAAVALIAPSLVRPADIASLEVPLAVVLPELSADDRLEWSHVLQAREDVLSIIAGADRSFGRNLPLVGRAVAALMERVSTT